MANHQSTDLFDLIMFESDQIRLEHRRYYHANPQEYLDLCDRALNEVHNGPLLGIVASAIFTGFSGGWVLGAIALASGLAQWWSSPKPETPRQPDAVFSPKYGSESLGGFARTGQIIPGIWCSRSSDPTGGVVTGGDLVHSRIETVNGTQITYARFVISQGEIGQIDLAKTTINEQPIQQFSQNDIAQSWQSGKPNGQFLADYPFYSQNLPATVNNTAGSGLISKSSTGGSTNIKVTNIANFTKTYSVLGVPIVRWYRLNIVPERFFTIENINVANSTISINQDLTEYLAVGQTIQFSTPAGGLAGEVVSLPSGAANPTFSVLAEEFEAYNNSSRYIAINENVNSQASTLTQFRVVDKIKYVQDGKVFYNIVSDTFIPKGNTSVYSYNLVQYQTTKRCDRIDLNLQLQVSGRNVKGELIDFACIYSLWIQKTSNSAISRQCYFYVRSSNPSTLFRSIELRGLALDSYSIEIRPEILSSTSSFGVFDCYEIKGDGSYLAAPIEFGSIKIQGELTTLSPAFLSGISNTGKDRAPDNSAQRGSTLVLQHVNEIQSKDEFGQFVDCNYRGLATVALSIKASEVIGRNQNFAFFVTEGIIVNQLREVVVSGDSTDRLFRSNQVLETTYSTEKPLYLRNLNKGQESLVLQIINSEIYLETPIDNSFGDEAILFNRGSSCWWPEIYTDLASQPKYGAAAQAISDYYLNYRDLVSSLRWVRGDNEHGTPFAWHGVLTARSELAVVNNNNCKKVLLLPSKSDGKNGFFEQKTPQIKALYNDHNSSKHKIETISSSRTDVNTLTVVYREQEAFYNGLPRLKYRQRDITIQTLDSYNRLVPESRATIELQECTSYRQAAITAQIMLNVARYGSKVAVSLNAATIESIGLSVGSLIDVRSSDAVAAEEYTGTVVRTTSSGFRLDKELILCRGRATGTSSQGLLDTDMDFIAAGVAIGDFIRVGSAMSPITSVSPTRLSCNVVVDNSEYEIIDATLDSLSARFIDNDGVHIVNSISQSIDSDGLQWLSLPDQNPDAGQVLSISAVSEESRIFQCLSVAPVFNTIDGDGKFECQIFGSNWDSRFFDYSDTVIVSHKGIQFNGLI